MELTELHVKILLKISQQNLKEASEITNGEILKVVKESNSYDEFEDKFKYLIKSKIYE